jgi:hypothetical protein
MALDFVATIPVATPNGGGALADLNFFDLDGNGKKYELTIAFPSLGTYPTTPTRLSENAGIAQTRKLGQQLLTPQGGVLIDANSTLLQALFTLPASTALFPVVGCVVSHLVIRGATISLSTVSVAAGWNAAGNNTFATATHTELTGPTLATVILATTGQTIGLPSGSFGIKNSIAQGVAANFTVDCFGYIF